MLPVRLRERHPCVHFRSDLISALQVTAIYIAIEFIRLNCFMSSVNAVNKDSLPIVREVFIQYICPIWILLYFIGIGFPNFEWDPLRSFYEFNIFTVFRVKPDSICTIKVNIFNGIPLLF